MDIAQEFAAEVTAAEHHLPGPALLPERLARACAAVLPVDGAGLSFFFAEDRRLPLGASDPTSAIAERLQFTVGDGPCLTAHSTLQPVVADEQQLQARWPAYADVLVARTPIRGVISLPLHDRLEGIGALDLYLRSPDDVSKVVLSDALAVLSTLSTVFLDAMAVESHHPSGPAWLDSPAVGRRALVWQAIGMVGIGLELPAPDALALLRAYAYGHDADLDAVADGLVERRLTIEELSLSTGAP